MPNRLRFDQDVERRLSIGTVFTSPMLLILGLLSVQYNIERNLD